MLQVFNPQNTQPAPATNPRPQNPTQPPPPRVLGNAVVATLDPLGHLLPQGTRKRYEFKHVTFGIPSHPRWACSTKPLLFRTFSQLGAISPYSLPYRQQGQVPIKSNQPVTNQQFVFPTPPFAQSTHNIRAAGLEARADIAGHVHSAIIVQTIKSGSH